MRSRSAHAVFRQVESLFCRGTVGGLTDGQLLERFVSRQDGMAETADVEMRLLGVNGDGDLVFGTYEPGSEAAVEQITVPKDLLAEIETDAEGWKALRERLTEGSFVDAQRLQMTTEPV